MKRTVRLFALVLLVTAIGATPSFATCRTCTDTGGCVLDPTSGTTCHRGVDVCIIDGNCAVARDSSTIFDQYTVASVEVTRPHAVPQKTSDAPKALASNTVRTTSRIR